MNRHSSNPFLSDCDDTPSSQRQDINAALQQARSMLPEPDAQQQQQPQQQQPPRRSSIGQAEYGGHTGNSSAAGAAARQGLYRRNMSSFEAASLQLERHQQQMLENGSTPVTHKDLIAKMTAEFQSAISTSDKQLDFNPFDPFETIVDDDSLPSPVPGSGTANNRDHEDDDDDGTNEQAVAMMTTNANGARKHSSIDDDEEELVSTPVRNIKASIEQPVDSLAAENSKEMRLSGADGDSREKASLFASLLASAESAAETQNSFNQLNSTSNNGSSNDADIESSDNVEEATHIIKGSPQSAGGDIERPVGFFDPFETVIDKDALCELMNGTSAISQPKELATDGDHQRMMATKMTSQTANSLKAGLNRSAGESVSIETVIENRLVSDLEAESPTNNNDNSRPNNDLANDSPATELPRPPTTSGRRLEQPASGFAAPQPTPLRRPKQKASGTKQKASFREDSSDSEEEDDRIQIVIRAKEDSKATGSGSGNDQQQTALPIVPLLPPPPSKSSLRQARERGQVEDMPSPIMKYKLRNQNKQERAASSSSSSDSEETPAAIAQRKRSQENNSSLPGREKKEERRPDGLDNDGGNDHDEDGEDNRQDDGQFVIPMRPEDFDDLDAGKSDTPLYDEDTSYVLEEFPPKYEGPGWELWLRYPPKKKLTSNRFWKKMFIRLALIPIVIDTKQAKQASQHQQQQQQQQDEMTEAAQTCWALQIFDKLEDKKPIQEIPLQATYTVSEISTQLFDQYGKIFTIKIQYIFYKERVGVRQGQLARFIHSGHIGTSTTSGGHGVDPISIGAIKRMGAPIEHSPQVSQIIKLGCFNYEDMKTFKEALEECLFRMPIHRDRALSSYKTEEVQMAVRDECYIEVNQIGTVTRQLARVRLFFLSFLNGQPIVEVGINDIHRQGREVVGRMDILPVVTEEWIRLEAWELHSTAETKEFDNVESRIIKLTPPDATFFELMRFRVRPPRNRELPLQISANMSVNRTKVSINCEVMIPGCVSRKHGQIACENIAIRIHIPECWIYFFREEKHFRMGSKKSVNRRPGKVKGIERFLGGAGGIGGLQEIDDESSLIEVTSGQAKYEHHYHAIVWRAARWPKDNQTAYVQNTMKIRLPLSAYDKMPESFCDSLQVEYTMPATTVSHTTLRSISVNPCDDEPPEKYVKYSAKYEYKVKMRLSVNLGGGAATQEQEASPIIIMKQPDLRDDLQKEADSDEEDEDDYDSNAENGPNHS